ncbi:MAG: hypothetical protein AAF996_11500 [Pseudomonadota bacterium]
MLRWCLIVLVSGVGAFAAAQGTKVEHTLQVVEQLEIEDCVENVEALLALDYWTFDQDPEQGVRSVYTKPECQLASAEIYQTYHQRLRDKGEPVIVDLEQGTYTISETGELTSLYWHEGQIRAGIGQIDHAIDLFEKSFKPKDRDRHGWNEYARATIAFLRQNKEELLRERAALAEKVDKNDINLGAVDGLIACFGRSYKEAYGSEDCNRRPGFDQ